MNMGIGTRQIFILRVVYMDTTTRTLSAPLTYNYSIVKKIKKFKIIKFIKVIIKINKFKGLMCF